MIITADALDGLKQLESCSVDCIVTSPPYYGLRDYGVNGQIGLEKTPEEYIEKLVAVFREARRVLKDDGTLWVNIADSYAGSGKGAAKYPENAKKYKQGTNKGMLSAERTAKIKIKSAKPKDMIGIPWMLAFALRNDGWYLRQDIIWHKPNPMPESVKDRCTKSHEYIFLLSKSRKYYFNAESIKEPCGNKGNSKTFRGGGAYTSNQSFNNSAADVTKLSVGNKPNETGLRNKRDVWTVATRGYKEAHFATFPPDLIEPCILAGCRPGGTVLDMFGGSGTTGLVADKLGRAYILIDINGTYNQMAENRIKRL